MEAVKGLQGYWHATKGDWYDKGSLRTICGKGISPNFRRFNEQDARRIINCPKCRDKIRIIPIIDSSASGKEEK